MSLISIPEHQQRPAPKGGARKQGKTKHVGRGGGKKKYQAPPIGRGQYVNAPNKPHWSHNIGNTKFWANAAVNNPGNTGAGVALGTATALQSQRSKMSEKGKRRTDVATGAAATGAAANVAGTKRAYKKIRWAQAPENNKDWSEGGLKVRRDLPKETQKEFKDVASRARRAGGQPGMDDKARIAATTKRQEAMYRDANFPKGFKSSNIRRHVGSGKAMRNVNRGSIAAGLVGGAAVAGGYKLKDKKVHKSSLSAFGVDHG